MQGLTFAFVLYLQELVVAFGGFVSVYLSQFVALAKKLMEEEKERMAMSLDMAGLYGYGKDGQRTGGKVILKR